MQDIEKAIELVVGPKIFTAESYLRRDLDIQSLELAEIFFQLRRLTGLEGVGEILFTTLHAEGANMDIQISRLQQALASKGEA